MTLPIEARTTLQVLDRPTRALVRLAAIVTIGDETAVRQVIARAAEDVPPVWIEELLLQTYLFAGFPRTLNAMREWRRLHPVASPDAGPVDGDQLRVLGEETCAVVYGVMYDRLRLNIRQLHPALDDWMIVEGYGKVLSRPALDLPRRELCIVAACAAAGQDRQLHSHLHGVLNAGVASAVVDAVIDELQELVGVERARTVRLLWTRVQGK